VSPNISEELYTELVLVLKPNSPMGTVKNNEQDEPQEDEKLVIGNGPAIEKSHAVAFC
jgi:hypothetical protein